MTEPHLNEGELVYGSVMPDGTDWRLRKFDGGMGETEYRIFRNEIFFAMFDNRQDADIVMKLMTDPATSAEKVLDDLITWIKETKEMARDNIDRGYGTRGDRHVEVILSQVLDKYAELQQGREQG